MVDGAVIIVGPEYRYRVAQLRRHRPGGSREVLIVGAERASDLKLPLDVMKRCMLFFEHSIPAKKGRRVSEGEIRAWTDRLLAPLKTASVGKPEIQVIADSSRASVPVLLDWNVVDRNTCLRAAKEIEASYVASGGTYSSRCFIATVACGTDQAEDVVRLREFRDVVLQRSKVGRSFISFYEATSPPIARLISRSRSMRFMMRTLIVRPTAAAADRVVKRHRRRLQKGAQR